jgi:pSer/pThr/pTyr-binding forkhead associated (FHA) protein
MKLSLVVLSDGKVQGQSVPITLPQFLIGRDPECHMRPASQLISKRHCALLVRGGKAFVRDLGSTNGTFVNEEQIKGERKLENDDTLKVGPLEFRVVLEVTPPVNKPTPPPPQVAAQVAAGPANDDDVAAMLLSLQDEGEAAAAKTDQDGIPSGTTVHMLPPLTEEEASGMPPPGAKLPDKKAPPPKKEPGNTSAAAAAILEKYTRRQRS